MNNLIYDLRNLDYELVVISNNDSKVYTYSFEGELFSDLHNIKHKNKTDELNYELCHNGKTDYYGIRAKELAEKLEDRTTRNLFYSHIDLGGFLEYMEL